MTRKQQIENSVDAQLFLRLREIAPPLLLSSYKIENTILQGLYNKFLVDRQNPDLLYSLQSKEELEGYRQKLLDLQDEIIHNHTNKSIESQYLLKIRQYLLNLDILLASKNEDWELFESLNVERYGHLDEADARGLVAVRQKKHDIFRGIIPSQPGTFFQRQTLDELVQLQSYFADTSFPEIDLREIYSAEQVRDLWNRELKERYPKWSCVCSSTVTYIRTDNRRRQVVIPNMTKLTGKKVLGLFAHEIGVHVRRREQGKNSRLQILSVGMAGSESSEEGIASIAEQVVGTRIRLGGTDRYIALALATGAVDDIKRDFKDTYALLEEYFTCRYEAFYEPEMVTRLSQTVAWKLCVKIFRGGNPHVPGCCMRKEKIYREGSVAMWNVFRTQPDVFALWPLGKFDLTNRDQVALVREYTELPQ